MTVKVEQLLVDSHDPRAQARFWADVLGYRIVWEGEDADGPEIEIGPPEGASGWNMLFIKVDDPKRGKNRLHLDLRPDDQAAEVERVKSLGATEVDIGQGEPRDDMTWVVLADPEGNEFCILRAAQS